MQQGVSEFLLGAKRIPKFLNYNCKENRWKFRPLIELFFFFSFWGPVERKARKDQLPWGTNKADWEGTKTVSPFHGLEGFTLMCSCTFTLCILLPGSEYVFYTTCGFSVVIKVTLWLTSETQSHFSDLMGQDMKEKEVKTWNWCVSAWERLPYVKGNIWNRWPPGKGCEGWVGSPGGRRKGWDCVWPPLCVGPHVYVDVVNHSACCCTGP